MPETHAKTGKNMALAQSVARTDNKTQDAAKNSAIEPFPEHDYEAIESAVMETARGRWFLQEYAQRNRHNNTDEVMQAIAALEQKIDAGVAPQNVQSEITISEYDAHINFAQLSQVIEHCAQTISSVYLPNLKLPPIDAYENHFLFLNDALKHINTQILERSEKVQELSYELEEAGVPVEHCRAIQDTTTDIFMDCSANTKLLNSVKAMGEALSYISESISAIAQVQAYNEKIAQSEAFSFLQKSVVQQHTISPEVALEQIQNLPVNAQDSAPEDMFVRVTQELSQLNMVPEGAFGEVLEKAQSIQKPQKKNPSNLTETLTDVLKIVEEDEISGTNDIEENIELEEMFAKKAAEVMSETEFHNLSFSEKYALFG